MAGPSLEELGGRRVAIWGFGEEGRSALAAVRRRHPELPVAVLDERPLAPDAAGPAGGGGPVEVHSGRGALDRLADFEVVIKSPGVSLYRPEIESARRRGTLFTSGTRLWFAERPAGRIVVVTGSKGKSTTAALAHHLLAAAGRRAVLGGNIGRPLLDLLAVEPPPEVWVLELSSYQTADLDAAPEVGVLLNLYPEHLDWHGSMERYFEDKVRFVAGARRQVLNARDPATRQAAGRFERPLWFEAPEELHVEAGGVARGGRKLLDAAGLPLAGRHNRVNLCAALAALEAAGERLEPLAPALEASLAGFRPLGHRLAPLGERHGLLWVDDSLSTIPEAALAAVDAFAGRPLTLLVGGHDRGLSYDGFARALVERAAAAPGLGAVVTLPDSGPRIAAALAVARGERSAGPEVLEAGDLDEAVRLARRATPEGGAVLLSPAAASYGRFRDHRERGRAFARAAGFDSGSGN